MSLFKEKIEKVLYIENDEALNQLPEDIQKEILQLYLKDTFQKDPSISKVLYGQSHQCFQRLEMVDLKTNQSENPSAETSAPKSVPEFINSDDGSNIGQIIQEALEITPESQYQKLKFYPDKPSPKEIQNDPCIYKSNQKYILLKGSTEYPFSHYKTAWIAFGLQEKLQEKFVALEDYDFNDLEFLLDDYLDSKLEHKKIYEAFQKSVEQADSEGGD